MRWGGRPDLPWLSPGLSPESVVSMHAQKRAPTPPPCWLLVRPEGSFTRPTCNGPARPRSCSSCPCVLSATPSPAACDLLGPRSPCAQLWPPGPLRSCPVLPGCVHPSSPHAWWTLAPLLLPLRLLRFSVKGCPWSDPATEPECGLNRGVPCAPRNTHQISVRKASRTKRTRFQ